MLLTEALSEIPFDIDQRQRMILPIFKRSFEDRPRAPRAAKIPANV